MKYGESYEGRKFVTDYIGKERPPASVVDEIRRVGKVLNQMGLTPENAGNISVRHKNGMYITVGGVNKGQVTEDDVVEVVDFDFERARVRGTKEPSSETPMHWLIYASFPMAAAIVHCHDELAVDSADKLKLAVGVHSTKEFAHYGTQDQAYQVIEALAHCQYAIIRKHGVVCMGQTLSEALELIVRINDSLRRRWC
jgi:L-fuculose-phosphate aldolase